MTYRSHVSPAITITLAAVGLKLDWLDKKTGATDKLNKSMREGGAYLEKKLPADYNGFGETLQQAMSFGGMGA